MTQLVGINGITTDNTLLLMWCLAKFYHLAFGWDAEMLDEEMGNYVVVTTAEGDAIPGAPAGAINGGFFQRSDDEAQHPSIVISVENIHNAVDRVTQADGNHRRRALRRVPGYRRKPERNYAVFS